MADTVIRSRIDATLELKAQMFFTKIGSYEKVVKLKSRYSCLCLIQKMAVKVV